MTPRSLSASEIAQWTNGTILQDGIGCGMQFDSRHLQENQWFVVLQGARDGHDFLPMAASKNCAGAIGQQMPSDWTKGFVQVEDSLLAFQQIAEGIRDNFANPVVGVTGSAGKTTTRALIASVLEGLGAVHQTDGNFNNHIGVPKTITDASGIESAWVLEMGMSALGEIHRLQEIGKPTIRVITNVGAAHVEGCGSIEGVARAKGELFAGARPNDTCCINLDDMRVRQIPIPHGATRLTYGKNQNADIRLLNSTVKDWSTLVEIQTPLGIIIATIPVPGEFMASNACAAVAVGIAANVPLQQIRQGLEKYQPVGMRMKLETIGSLRVINDAYNANVLSMKAAIDSLCAQSTPTKIALLGDMLEMGESEDSVHQEVLAYAFDADVRIGLVGPRFQNAWRQIQANYPHQTILHLSQDSQTFATEWTAPTENATILLKGSRGMRMEKILQQLQNGSEHR